MANQILEHIFAVYRKYLENEDHEISFHMMNEMSNFFFRWIILDWLGCVYVCVCVGYFSVHSSFYRNIEKKNYLFYFNFKLYSETENMEYLVDFFVYSSLLYLLFVFIKIFNWTPPYTQHNILLLFTYHTIYRFLYDIN